MKGSKMDINWRTVQMFIGDDGVCEVQVDSDNHSKARCTCPNFMRIGKCKHVRHVKRQMEDNNGHYTVVVPDRISDEEASEAMRSPEDFRSFLIKHARVEVL
jgi:hypothetical protein